MKTLAKISALVVTCLAACAGAQDVPITFHLGDEAPSLEGGKVLQGSVPLAFQKGTVYFLDFWATWCGPCAHAAPSVEALNQKSKYKGKVVFIGLDVFESSRGSFDLKKVQAHLKAHPELKYPVVADDSKGSISTRFLKAAGFDAIPTFMIVDGSGKFVWAASGDDAQTLDSFGPTLDKVLDGTWDVNAFRKGNEQNLNDERELRAAYKLMYENKYQGALEAAERVTPHSQGTKQERYEVMLASLVQVDVPKAIALGNELKVQYKEDPLTLESLWWWFSSPRVSKECYKFALETLLEWLSRKPSWTINNQMATTYSLLDDLPKAIDAMQRAIEMVKNSKIAEPDRSVILKYCADRLAGFRKVKPQKS